MKWNYRRGACRTLLAAVGVAMALPLAAQTSRPHVALPEGAVRDVILDNCSSCHGIDDYAFNALDRAGWQELIDQRHKLALGVKIAGRDEAVLLDYLVETFGPESIPFPREYTPPEITTFFSDVDARVFLDRVCTECHELRVFDRRGTPAEWRARVLDMRERGAELSDENLERLVEWLGRVRGENPFE